MTQIKGLLKDISSKITQGIWGQTTAADDGSIGINDENIIEAFRSDPNNTFLVSFPRTGSHWLRMIMELYFGRPSLVRVFYYPNRHDYLTLHTHDLELNIERSNVIYLYRDPVDTIYSQLCYYKEPINNHECITYWSDLYGRHLHKWLHSETFTNKKTVIKFERLRDDIETEFKKICEHFDVGFDMRKVQVAIARISKKHVKQKIRHDHQVVNLTKKYEKQRDHFRAKHGEFVWHVLLHQREHLRGYF